MSEQPLWGHGSGAALWAQMLDISRELQPQFDALASLAAAFGELLWLSGQSGSPAERVLALLGRRLPAPLGGEPLHHPVEDAAHLGEIRTPPDDVVATGAHGDEIRAQSLDTGNLLIGVGLRLLKVTRLPVADLLPALVVAPLLTIAVAAWTT